MKKDEKTNVLLLLRKMKNRPSENKRIDNLKQNKKNENSKKHRFPNRKSI